MEKSSFPVNEMDSYSSSIEGLIRAPFAACLISSRMRHHVATVAVRNSVLVWVRKGTKYICQPQLAAEFRAGELMILIQGSQWDVVNDIAPHGEYEALVLQFGTEALRLFEERYQSEFSLKPIENYAKLGIDAQLERSIQHAADGFQSVVSARLKAHRILEVLLLLAERGCVLPSEKELTWPDKVRRLVSQRPHADWSLSAIAQFFHISESTLRRRLAEFDITAGDLIREIRMEIALVLLQTSKLSVSEVAQRCGYESHSRFSAAFRARFGYSPSYLRSQS